MPKAAERGRWRSHEAVVDGDESLRFVDEADAAIRETVAAECAKVRWGCEG